MSEQKQKLTICLLNPQGHVRWKEPQIAEHPDTGGQIVYILELAKEFEKAGCRVDIFTRYFKDPDWPGYDREIEDYNENLRIARIKCGKEDRFIRKEKLWPLIKDFSAGVKKFYRDQGYQPDIITSHYADAGLAAGILKKDLKKPYVHTGHSLGGKKMDNLNLSRSNFEMINKNFSFHLRISAERISFKNANRVIVSTQEEIDQQYGHRVYKSIVSRNKEKFCIIPPGIDPENFFSYHRQEKDTEKYKKAVGLLKKQLKRSISKERKDLPCVFSAARFDAKKNPTGLLRAYASSRQLQENMNLLIVAGNVENPLTPKNRNKFKEHEKYIIEDIASIIEGWKLKGKVCLSPGFDYMDEMPYIYRYAGRNKWIFVNPALHEPFGLTIIEAMASGLPVVATKHGGPAEILNGGEFGILTESIDPLLLASSLEELLIAGKWRNFSKKGMERVKKKFTWKAATASYMKVFKKVKKEGVQNKGDFPIPDYFLKRTKKNESHLMKELRSLMFSQKRGGKNAGR